MPHDLVQAVLAMSTTMLLGLGIGIINAVVVMAFPGWIVGYVLLFIVLYMTSGILFMPAAVPEIVQKILAFNPTLHIVEWMREAYFEGYVSPVLDKTYLVSWGVGSLFIGLALERLIRGKLLQG